MNFKTAAAVRLANTAINLNVYTPELSDLPFSVAVRAGIVFG